MGTEKRGSNPHLCLFYPTGRLHLLVLEVGKERTGDWALTAWEIKSKKGKEANFHKLSLGEWDEFVTI